MRVEDSGSHIDAATSASRASATDRAAPSTASSPTGATVVAASAGHVSAASDRSRAAHTARLEAVRTQLQSGTYKVDKQALASRMADDELARS